MLVCARFWRCDVCGWRAQVIAYSWEWVLSHESISKVYDKAGNCVRPEASVDTVALAAKTKKPALRGPTRLEWLLHAKAREAISEAVVHAKALCEDLDLVVDCFSTKTGGSAPPSVTLIDSMAAVRVSWNAARHLRRRS
jgi:hypothetical protein